MMYQLIAACVSAHTWAADMKSLQDHQPEIQANHIIVMSLKGADAQKFLTLSDGVAKQTGPKELDPKDVSGMTIMTKPGAAAVVVTLYKDDCATQLSVWGAETLKSTIQAYEGGHTAPPHSD